jgi:hypothetical protein
MNTPASAVVPSREAVENIIREKHLGSLDNTCTKCGTTVADMLRTLLAEVERLTFNLEVTKENFDEARATVAEQGAALELCKMWVEDNSKAGIAIRAALASAQSG